MHMQGRQTVWVSKIYLKCCNLLLNLDIYNSVDILKIINHYDYDIGNELPFNWIVNIQQNAIFFK